LSIGERLKKLRLSTKKTLKEVSEILGISLNTVYRWEHDLCTPRKSVIKKMADFYGVQSEWILTGEGQQDSADYDGRAFTPVTDVEQKILKMIRRLPESKKHSIIGYIDRIYMEEQEKKEQEGQILWG